MKHVVKVGSGVAVRLGTVARFHGPSKGGPTASAAIVFFPGYERMKPLPKRNG